MPEGFALLAMILKGIGALSGSALALLVKPAKTLAEFGTRLGCSVLAGILFSTPVRERIGWAGTEEYIIASATIASFCAWWIMAAVVRIIEKWEGPRK
jgi:urea transporter